MAQRVVTGIGVVAVVTVRNICQTKHTVSLVQLYYLDDDNKNTSLRSTYYENNSDIQLNHVVSVDNRTPVDNNS